MFGFEPLTLRLFSIAVAVATYLLLFWFLHSESGNLRNSVLGTAFVALHPYMLYLSVFIYTDTLAILCLIAALVAVRRERPIWLALALCGGVLNRQYLVFATAATGAYYVARFVQRRRRADLMQVLAVAASAIPLAGLCWLWGGLCPDGALKHVYPDQHATFHVSSLVLYISLIPLYLSPLLVVHWRRLPIRKQSILIAAAFCWLYWLFPAAPSRSAVEAQAMHVGMLHQFLARLSGGDLVPQCFFFAGFTAGLAVIAEWIFDAAGRLRSGRLDFQFFLDLVVFAFLAVMPWSYLHWEKYLMPLIPVLVLRVLFVPFQESTRWSSGFGPGSCRIRHDLSSAAHFDCAQRIQTCGRTPVAHAEA